MVLARLPLAVGAYQLIFENALRLGNVATLGHLLAVLGGGALGEEQRGSFRLDATGDRQAIRNRCALYVVEPSLPSDWLRDLVHLRKLIAHGGRFLLSSFFTTHLWLRCTAVMSAMIEDGRLTPRCSGRNVRSTNL
jgi:hypothetical protein